MMRFRGQVYVGGAIILIGILFLIGNLTGVDLGLICWPVALIALGVLLLARPRMLGDEIALTQSILGSTERRDAWRVTDEEFWAFIVDMKLDMRRAEIPEGETRLRIFGFVGEVELWVPEGVGVSVSSTSFVNQVKFPDRKEESFLRPLHLQTKDYEVASRRIRLDMGLFVGEVKLKQG